MSEQLLGKGLGPSESGEQILFVLLVRLIDCVEHFTQNFLRHIGSYAVDFQAKPDFVLKKPARVPNDEEFDKPVFKSGAALEHRIVECATRNILFRAKDDSSAPDCLD